MSSTYPMRSPHTHTHIYSHSCFWGNRESEAYQRGSFQPCKLAGALLLF